MLSLFEWIFCLIVLYLGIHMISIVTKSGEILRSIDSDSLENIDLEGANLRNANLSNSNLENANLKNIDWARHRHPWWQNRPGGECCGKNCALRDPETSDESDPRNTVYCEAVVCVNSLVVAERTAGSGQKLLAAMFLGYEVAGRINGSMIAGLETKGFILWATQSPW